MFGRKKRTSEQQANYDRVYQLHLDAEFLCYIEDAYIEREPERSSMKLEGIVVKGIGKKEDLFGLYNCNGIQKAVVRMEEFYSGKDKVDVLYAEDKKVALYPIEQDVPYKAGDFLCRMGEEDGNHKK